jgi:hypothetical protein
MQISDKLLYKNFVNALKLIEVKGNIWYLISQFLNLIEEKGKIKTIL